MICWYKLLLLQPQFFIIYHDKKHLWLLGCTRICGRNFQLFVANSNSIHRQDTRAHFLSLFGVSPGCARPITGQVTSVTWPVIGRAQPQLPLSKRQKIGPGLWLAEHSLSVLQARDRKQALNPDEIMTRYIKLEIWIDEWYLINLKLQGSSYEHGINLIPAWISNRIHYKLWHEITYLFQITSQCSHWSLGRDK